VEEGDTIPADARLVEEAALRTAEAALTGESLPVVVATGMQTETGRIAGMLREAPRETTPLPTAGQRARWFLFAARRKRQPR
jgi:P-type Ca2+ transporter type 2C